MGAGKEMGGGEGEESGKNELDESASDTLCFAGFV